MKSAAKIGCFESFDQVYSARRVVVIIAFPALKIKQWFVAVLNIFSALVTVLLLYSSLRN